MLTSPTICRKKWIIVHFRNLLQNTRTMSYYDLNCKTARLDYNNLQGPVFSLIYDRHYNLLHYPKVSFTPLGCDYVF